MTDINATHDASLRSWLESANATDAEFPIQNLPLGMFMPHGEPPGPTPRPGVAIGDSVLDLRALELAGLLQADAAAAVRAVGHGLNGMMALGNGPASALRGQLSELLRVDGNSSLRKSTAGLLHPMAAVDMSLPCEIGDYTDFLTSFHHTERHGRFKNLADPVPPVFHSLPVAYHGRASSIRPAGMAVRRPNGQWREPDGSVRFGPVQAMDFELEVAAFVGKASTLGRPVALDDAPSHIFGYALLNDWSAKSVQWWEQMLGPFLGKSFMSTLSPWVVTAEALAPFAMPAPARRTEAPALLPYLFSTRDQRAGGMDIAVEAWLSTQAMRDAGSAPVRLAASHLSRLSWTFGQMLTHHASNGCNLNPGDLLGSGTISGERDEERACLTEITSAGREPLLLPNGEQRLWLLDGDEITLKARASAEGRVSIGFGPCSASILPAFDYPLGTGPAAA
ncbi:MAG: fumarylacetoacetase [Polaromonas sp.]|nr:fumarylacetoacetase [Polaromonas sp.]